MIAIRIHETGEAMMLVADTIVTKLPNGTPAALSELGIAIPFDVQLGAGPVRAFRLASLGEYESLLPVDRSGDPPSGMTLDVTHLGEG